MRCTLEGWSFSHELCAEKAREAREFRRQRGWESEVVIAEGLSMDDNWGYPSESFVEHLAEAATADDWQHLTFSIEQGD